jgi:hypothetical protein
MKRSFILFAIVVLIFGCENEKVLRGTPECIENMINEMAADQVWNPPAKVYSYTYNGSTVYFIPQRCCDIPSSLMDDNCNYICSPDGGIGGGGNGECDDFFETRE